MARINIKTVSRAQFLKAKMEFALSCVDDNQKEILIHLPKAGADKLLLSMEAAVHKGHLTDDDFPELETMMHPTNMEITPAPGGILISLVLTGERRASFFFSSALPEAQLKTIAFEVIGLLGRARSARH